MQTPKYSQHKKYDCLKRQKNKIKNNVDNDDQFKKVYFTER